LTVGINGRVTPPELDTLPGMDIIAANSWNPPESWISMKVVDSHAGGEPFRVVTDGLPEIPGDTVLDRRRYASQHLDHLRQALMWEPRGHRDMYGGWIGAPVAPDSDFSILFTHNEGYSTMCGHGIIAVTKVVLDTRMMKISAPETTLRIDTPAGQVTSVAHIIDGAVERVRFRNVASFVDSLDQVIEVDGIGAVTYDLAFGGAYYAYVDAPLLGIPWPPTDSRQLIDYGRGIKRAIVEHGDIHHPEHADLGFLYGVIFSGPPVDPHNHVRNVCVFADGEIDRSPTGTGVSGHVALETARGRMSLGDRIVVESIVGSEFAGTLVDLTRVGDRVEIVPEVTGRAHVIGRSEFWFDPEDELSPGFLLP
jgi:proline racemase